MRTPNSKHTLAEHCGRVLVVDDHAQVRRMISLALETAGLEVIAAGTQLELQRRLADSRPDAVLIDLQRAQADGLMVLARIRARQPLGEVPIAFLAGSDDHDFRRRAMAAGADWFGLRPLGMRELQTQVVNLVRNGRPATQPDRLPRPPAGVSRLKLTG